VINDLSMGDIERIDMVSKTTEKGEKFNRVFIHFRKWADDGNAAIARERLVNGKEIKIVYDEPWFWKVSAYRKDTSKNRGPAPPRKHEAKKPSFCFDSQDQDQNQRRQTQNQRQNQRQEPRQNQRQEPRQNQRQEPRQNHNQRPRSHTPPPTPPHTPPPVEEGPTGEYVDVPTIDYGNVNFTKRKPLKAKVALTIVDPAELSP
jgi:hypothetical protein